MYGRFQTFTIVFNILGSLFIVLGFFLLFPLIVVVSSAEIETGLNTSFAFIVPASISFLLGVLFRRLFRPGNPSTLQATLVCTLGWLGCSALGALPFVFCTDSSYLNGFFEAMSGFTTTGITMFTGLDLMPRSILFWRSLTQWIGGLGILTFFLTVTYRGGSAHRLFGAESHKIGIERPVPGLANTLRILWGIYIGFTAFIAVNLLIAGMPLFDTVCHSFTALSTGGFSPHDASIGHYRMSGHPHFVWLEYILIVGMLMGGTNFLVHYRVVRRDWRGLFDTTEMKYWWGFIIAFTAVITLERFLKLQSPSTVAASAPGFWKSVEENFRTVTFQVVAIITTTGFGTHDIGGPFFGQVARQLFLVMMVIGGCVGSTGGGLKVLRVSILVQLVRREIFRLRMPSRAISAVIIDGKPIEYNEIYRVAALFFSWIAFLIVGGTITALFSSLDAYKAFSGMFSALGNIGPCYIPVGAMGLLHPVIKIVYIVGMLAGRLEILPVLLLFSRKAWRS